ncbi:MAG: TraB/GumN family protein [Myxococcota bacterium]
MRRFPLLLAALLGLVLPVACATESAPAPPIETPILDVELPEPWIDFPAAPGGTYAPGTPARPGLWRAEGDRGSFFLFGSIHFGNEDLAFGPLVEEAYARSDEVVMEIDLSKVDPEQTLLLAEQYGTLEPPATLESVLTPETWALVEARFAEAGQPVEAVQGMQPWWLGFALVQGAYLSAGLIPEQGIDRQIDDRARGGAGPDAASDPKPVIGLETLESQLQTLADLPIPVQDRLLRDALDPDPDRAADPAQLVRSWQSGDTDALTDLLDPQDPELATFYEHVIYKRNEQMARRLEDLAQDGKLRFVVVGLLHLVGERGIPALLSGRGYAVSRIE